MTTFVLTSMSLIFLRRAQILQRLRRFRDRGGHRIGRERQRQKGQNQKMRKYRYIDRAVAETKLQQRQKESKNIEEDIDEDGAETE
jgi:hypothetical protein